MDHPANTIRRLWLIYAAFVGIVLFCAALFFLQLASSEDSFLLRQVGRTVSGDRPFVLGVTDLPCSDSDTLHTFRVEGVATGGEILARVSTFDMAVFSNNADVSSSPLVAWAFVLQVFSMLAMLAIVVLVVIMLTAVHRTIRIGRVFQWRNVRMLRAVGVLMLLMTLAVDTSLFFERKAAYAVLQSTDWVPQIRYTIHFTRIFFALVVLFVAELIHIGHTMQQEQDLTI